MHGGLSINPLKFLGAPPPETFLSLRLTPHPEEERHALERYARALEGIDWAPGHIGYSDTWNTSVWVRDAPADPDARAEAVARIKARGEMKCRGEEVG